EAFYESLNDEQKERFNDIGPAKAAASTEARDALPDDAKTCGEAKPGLTNLPIEQIEDALKPNEAQLAELDKLGEATVKAVGILQSACPAETPLTPPGRLQAIETRLQAMIEAARTVKPPLDSFYASLNAEQKARFNRLGRDLAQTAATSNQ
ncbi:MAG: Spy/CpxP family protein refolding chaperone, partial [Pseudolabrys sp.]|nr:Spy/CpxP family protein refolding chaperone [Pseudolabrys sp.]